MVDSLKEERKKIIDIEVYLDKPLVQVRNIEECVFVGMKTSNDNSKSNNTTIATSNVCISCLPTTIFL
jgi:hypothetical protein